MHFRNHPIGYYTFSIIFILSIFSIGNWFERHQSLPLLLAYTSGFMGYIFLLQEKDSPRLLLRIGLISRLLFFFSLPTLSDDIYRFIWDGMLLKNGIHPFAELPGHYLDQNMPGINQALFNKLNSPEYFTIYPPLNQFIFWFSVSIGKDWLAMTNVIRIILLAADIGTLILLKKLLITYGKPPHLAFWYFLNPLVIIEFTGNVHFEGLVIFLLLVGIFFYEQKKSWFSAAGFGMAVGTKLLPLIYLPFLLFKELKSSRWWISIAALFIGILTLVPMVNQAFFNGIITSLDLYFRTFEFNASLYFIAREIGILAYGYNQIALIGPLLSFVSLLSILWISILGVRNKWSVPMTFLFILSAYLLFTTTVHPWYIIPLSALGLLSGFWYPFAWSFLIFLTYFGYTKNGFDLPLWIVVVEYLSVISVFVVELQSKKKNV